jgi:hypothetical protein
MDIVAITAPICRNPGGDGRWRIEIEGGINISGMKRIS